MAADPIPIDVAHGTGIDTRNSALLIQTGLGEFRDQWDALVSEQPIPSPFLHSSWVESGVRFDPVFILVARGGDLLGGLALEMRVRLGIRFLYPMANQLWQQHFDLVVRPGHAHTVCKAVRRWTQAQTPYTATLSGVTVDSRLQAALPGLRSQAVTGISYWTSLTPDPDEYYASRSAKFRSNLRRDRRVVEAADLVGRVVPADDVERGLENLHRLHASQYANASVFLPQFETFARAARSGIRSGNVNMVELAGSGGRVVAVDVLLRSGHRAVGYIGGRDPKAPRGSGNVLKAFGLELMGRAGVTEYDFGAGYGDWKEKWAPNRRQIVKLVASEGLSARALHRLQTSRLRKLPSEVGKRIGRKQEPNHH